MSEANVEHRSSDTTDINVRFDRKIPLTWVIGGALSLTLALSLFFGTWAWNISLTLNNVSRDMTLATKTLEKLEAGQKEATTELNKGINRDSVLEGRIADVERRFNTFEARQEAQKAVRQP